MGRRSDEELSIKEAEEPCEPDDGFWALESDQDKNHGRMESGYEHGLW